MGRPATTSPDGAWRVCSACREVYPLDAEHFHRRSTRDAAGRRKEGFAHLCKTCANASCRRTRRKAARRNGDGYAMSPNGHRLGPEPMREPVLALQPAADMPAAVAGPGDADGPVRAGMVRASMPEPMFGVAGIDDLGMPHVDGCREWLFAVPVTVAYATEHPQLADEPVGAFLARFFRWMVAEHTQRVMDMAVDLAIAKAECPGEPRDGGGR